MTSDLERAVERVTEAVRVIGPSSGSISLYDALVPDILLILNALSQREGEKPNPVSEATARYVLDLEAEVVRLRGALEAIRDDDLTRVDMWARARAVLHPGKTP